ncbi:MAG: outer membrane lipoprotein carrier protein LolA [Prevotellaceae bacterium]|jgi:outer membrane lipoprotein-sorting protein|nr:outer membrane lipoprotein carrier protein LolA [Prevotellaceae bacterium]
MKKIPLLISATLLYLCAPAQDKAKSILDDFNKAMKSYPSMDIRFTLTSDDEVNNIIETKDGRVLCKGSAFKLIMDDIEVYSDGKTKWTIMHDVNEINIQEVDPDSNDMFDNPINFFTVNNKDFKYSYKGSTIIGGKVMEKIEFEPKDKRAAYSVIELRIEKNTLYPYEVSYIGKEGESYSVKVKLFTPNAKIEDVQLDFKEQSYSGYEIIDLR